MANQCAMCLVEEESGNHLFAQLGSQKGLESFLSQLSISWSFLGSFKDLISQWWIRELEGISFYVWHFLLGLSVEQCGRKGIRGCLPLN